MALVLSPVGAQSEKFGNKGMNVLVTGGAGYIGSHAAKALVRANFTPVVIDNLSTGSRELVRWGKFIEGDVADEALLERVLQSHKITTVMHFAACAYVGESVHQPQKYFHNNVVNTLSLLKVMLAHDVKSIVFSSTCATYGHPERVPITEDHEQRPINPYGESKLFVERALRWYGKVYDLKWIALRYFNAAGADPDGEVGEIHDPETHLVPLAILAALGENPGAEIFGSDYPTPDGTAIRDYVHVHDIAEAHVSALKYLTRGGESLCLNLGSGAGASVREIIRKVQDVSGRTFPVRECPRREGDPSSLMADSSKARLVLEWEPRHSSLDEIVRTAWKWHQRRVALSPRKHNPVSRSGIARCQPI